MKTLEQMRAQLRHLSIDVQPEDALVFAKVMVEKEKTECALYVHPTEGVIVVYTKQDSLPVVFPKQRVTDVRYISKMFSDLCILYMEEKVWNIEIPHRVSGVPEQKEGRKKIKAILSTYK